MKSQILRAGLPVIALLASVGVATAAAPGAAPSKNDLKLTTAQQPHHPPTRQRDEHAGNRSGRVQGITQREGAGLDQVALVAVFGHQGVACG